MILIKARLLSLPLLPFNEIADEVGFDRINDFWQQVITGDWDAAIKNVT